MLVNTNMPLAIVIDSCAQLVTMRPFPFISVEKVCLSSKKTIPFLLVIAKQIKLKDSLHFGDLSMSGVLLPGGNMEMK